MLLACMHRGTHRHNPYYVSDEPHFGGDRLIWLYDLHLLAGSFSEHDWQSLIARAEGKGLLGACGRSRAGARRFEPNSRSSAALLRPDHAKPHPTIWTQSMDPAVAGFSGLPGTRRKARYLRELVFPPKRICAAGTPTGGAGGCLLYASSVRRHWRRLRGREF
jgi:hypothetical protein